MAWIYNAGGSGGISGNTGPGTPEGSKQESARQDHGRNGAKAHKTARVRVQIALDATVGRKSIKNARRDGGRKV